MRAVSLLPAATEIVAALGMLDHLVGVSHECDYPPAVNDLPRVTRCTIHGNALPSADIDRWVRSELERSGTLYTMDEPLLRRLAPDVIITQRLCDVCAVGFESVTAFAATLPGPPQVVNLEPQTLEEVFEDIRRVAAALGVERRADQVIADLRRRVEAVCARAASSPRRRCVLLEWIDPPFRSGHWDPELVALAGGEDPVGRSGEDAAEVGWDEIRAVQPEVLVIACCGFDLARTRDDLPILRAYPGFADLPAVRRRELYLVDGSAYFSRPGPRLVDSLELLAPLVHPELYPDATLPAGVARP
jgi:iron complex transport system substrate-binding protein